jgi:hypothetical protein
MKGNSETVMLTEQKAWKELSRSIEGEKLLSETSSAGQRKKQNLFNQELSKKAGIRGRSPLNSYNNQEAD